MSHNPSDNLIGTLTATHTATQCSTLRHTTKHCNTLQHTATHCSILQHTTTHCNTLQHTATHYNTLQHIQRITKPSIRRTISQFLRESFLARSLYLSLLLFFALSFSCFLALTLSCSLARSLGLSLLLFLALSLSCFFAFSLSCSLARSLFLFSRSVSHNCKHYVHIRVLWSWKLGGGLGTPIIW